MNWIGDYPEDFTTVCVYFTTHDGNGAPVAPLTAFEAADVSIYKNGSNAQKTSTNGVTMTSPFDSIVGLHCVVIDTSNDTGDSGFWTTGGGGVYTVLLNPDTETVNGQVALKVIGTFGIALSPALRPTTAGRTLDVSATGEAGVDWANVGSPTTALALTGTTIATTQKVDVDTIKTNPVVNGGTATFPTNATLASTTNITAGAITTVTNLTNAPTNGDLTTAMKASVNTEADTALADYDAPTHAELTVELATADDATLSAIAALSIPTANANADALLDRSAGVETGMTPRQALRLIAATTGAKMSGGGTTTNTFRNAVADSKDRVTATVDTSGNRSAITYDLT